MQSNRRCIKKAVVIYTKSSICTCHSAKALFHELGGSPATREVDQDANRKELYGKFNGKVVILLSQSCS